MADVVVSDPAAPAAPADPVVPVVPAAPPSVGEPDAKWLAPRLEQAQSSARKALLKELGVENLDDAKAVFADVNARKEATKTAEQKAVEATTKLTQAEKEAKEYKEIVRSHATTRLASLSEEQRKAVEAVAGDDPATQLRTIEALSPTWSKKPAVTPPVTPALITDTVPGGKPPEAPNVTPPSAKATWESLKTTNPILADRFLLANQKEIFGK